jgi:5-methylcytosine-specific restriction endonuclease McrA
LKKQLFDRDSTCEICHNKIMAIEDAEVDHKDPYSKGGPTTIENAQLAHRYCNRHKSDKKDADSSSSANA